jgi:hypothetical protein
MSVSIVSCKQNPSGENAHFIGHLARLLHDASNF